MADFELIVATKAGRLDKYISEHSDLSRSRVQELLGSGDILVNGKQEVTKLLTMIKSQYMFPN